MAFLMEGQAKTWVSAFAFPLCCIIPAYDLVLINSEVRSDSSFT